MIEKLIKVGNLRISSKKVRFFLLKKLIKNDKLFDKIVQKKKNDQDEVNLD